MWAVPAHALSSHGHAAVRGPGLCLGLPLSALVDLLRHTQGGPGLGPSRVKGGVGEYFRHLSGGDAVAAWVRDNGHAFDGPAFNIYHVNPSETDDPEEYVTEVCYPVKKRA